MLECPQYEEERTQLQKEIQLRSGEDLIVCKILGSWENEASATTTTNAPLRYLSATGLNKKL